MRAALVDSRPDQPVRAYRAPRTSGIIGAAIEVHRQLGPGLLESIYLECLCRELAIRGIPFIREVPLPVIYKGLNLECGYRLDLLVNNEVVVELKSLEHVLPVHEAQLMTYLHLTGKKVGLLINFNVPLLAQGIIRRVLCFSLYLCASVVGVCFHGPIPVHSERTRRCRPNPAAGGPHAAAEF